MPRRNRRPTSAVALCLACATALTTAAWGQEPVEPGRPGDDVGRFAAPPPPPTIEFTRRHSVVGFGLGSYTFRGSDFNDWYTPGWYYGLRWSFEINLRWAMSASAGYMLSEPEGDRSGLEDIKFFPVVAQFEVGSCLGDTFSRWYMAGGAGVNIVEGLPSDDKEDMWPEELPDLSTEVTAHAALGLEFRNDTLFSTRIEAGHMWLTESNADMWFWTITVSYQF